MLIHVSTGRNYAPCRFIEQARLMPPLLFLTDASDALITRKQVANLMKVFT